MAFCINCVSNEVDMEEYLEHLFISLCDIDFLYEVQGDEEIQCKECKRILEEENLYIQEDEIEDFNYIISEFLGERLSEEIIYCAQCEGQELEYYVDKYNYIFEEDGKEMDYLGHDVEELLSDYNVPNELEDNVLENLRCSHCGNGERPTHKDNMYSEPFNRYSRYYTERIIAKFYSEDDQWLEDLRVFLHFQDRKLARDEIEDFVNVLQNRPNFASEHTVGQIIYDTLKDLYVQKKYYKLHKSKILYRGRRRNPNIDRAPFTVEKMWNPPLEAGIAQGRYNRPDDSVLYCSSNYSAVPLETTGTGILNIATLQTKSVLKLLPINQIFSQFEGFMFDGDEHEHEERRTYKRKYLLPNYVKDCCDRIGFNGVTYLSVKEKQFMNYALFTFERDKDIRIIQTKEVE